MNRMFLWALFGFVFLVMMVLDLGVFHRKPKQIRWREAISWSLIWVFLSLFYNLAVWRTLGIEQAGDFFTAYVIEKSLSVDNIFVFFGIFSFFKLQQKYQHRVLHWGILGALIMRAIFIMGGIKLLERAHWLIYVFGAFLIITGLRMAFRKTPEMDPETSWFVKACRKFLPMAPSSHPQAHSQFFVRIKDQGVRATPLFLVLLVVEISDAIFALDSIPAVLSISQDPLIVYTSNGFAIMGLRSLYFALAGFTELFDKLHYGLSLVLVFVGVKMLLEECYPIPTPVALTVIVCLIGVSVFASLRGKKARELMRQK